MNILSVALASVVAAVVGVVGGWMLRAVWEETR